MTSNSMYLCPECAASIDLTAYRTQRRQCPNCGAPIQPQMVEEWVDVARVRNLAEAGFLTDELSGLGIDAKIHQLEDFNAVSARWSAVYLIRVPREQTQDAIAQIRHHLAEEPHEFAREPERFAIDYASDYSDALSWRPVALVVLAGVASFVLGQRFSAQDVRAERKLPQKTLLSNLEAAGRPLVTEAAPGEPRHRLSFDRGQRVWLLESDQDGDGRYEVGRMFHASGTAW